MPANLQGYAINPDPVAVWGLLSALGSVAIYGVTQLVKLIVRHRRAAGRLLAASLDPEAKGGDNTPQGDTVTTAILQYLAAQERRDIAERQTREAREHAQRDEEARRWERVEALTIALRDQASALQTVLMAVQNSALYQDQAHQYHAKQLEGIQANQVKLSDWLRDNMPRYRYGGQAPASGQSPAA